MRDEIAAADPSAPTELPLVRAGVLESIRPLIPFSEGPVECPGRNLVLLTTSRLLAALLARSGLRQSAGRALGAGAPLPVTLSPFRLAFEPV